MSSMLLNKRKQKVKKNFNALNLCNVICQLYLSRAGENRSKSLVDSIYMILNILKIFSSKLYLLIREFNSFKVITDNRVFTTAILIIFCMSRSFFVLSFPLMHFFKCLMDFSGSEPV